MDGNHEKLEPPDPKTASVGSVTGAADAQASSLTQIVDAEEVIEILFAVQGHRQHFGQRVSRASTVMEFSTIAAVAGGLEGEIEVFVEDVEVPLDGSAILIEQLTVEFSPLHVARRHTEIGATVEYNGQHISRKFRPSVTIERVIKWAIGPEGFPNLEGDPCDFQMKHAGEILPPDLHVGQIPHPHHEVRLDLVFKVKPQG